MTATILWITVPLVALAFALWSGIPLWMVFRYPDRDPRETRTIPAYLAYSAHRRDVLPPALEAQLEAQLEAEAAEQHRERELVGASSR
jgi:hypothetical protein